MLQSPFSFTPRKDRCNSNPITKTIPSVLLPSQSSCNTINKNISFDIPSTPEPKSTTINMLNTPPSTTSRRNSTNKRQKSTTRVTKTPTKTRSTTRKQKQKQLQLENENKNNIVLPLSPPMMSSIELKLKLIQSKLSNIDNNTSIKSDISTLLDSTLLEINQQQEQLKENNISQSIPSSSPSSSLIQDLLPKLTNDQILQGSKNNYILETPKNQILSNEFETYSPPLAPKQDFNSLINNNNENYSNIDFNLISCQLDFLNDEFC
ncbi:uncharacterized protein KGF55_005050 [Candida pseudojiufengensis]|uniref:uncharacterized protein n=1 Tax=Candida pseudojiufengensis TaxID=497109 RepID=UPI0022258C42|nr:uncharacterized protein KGF55_005050 [Candida pseudojiufengensis]KAI5959818.1 hypothetical protein KGF55_005050 [Candida pseudojiufengensis]